MQPPCGSMHGSSSWGVASVEASSAATEAGEAGGSPHWTIGAGINGGRSASRRQLLPGQADDGSSACGAATVAPSSARGSKLPGSTGTTWRWRQRRHALALYLLPRVAVLGYFAAWLLALPLSGAYSLHLHHYALGWAVGCFGAFNHPVSGLVLVLGSAVFVQVGG